MNPLAAHALFGEILERSREGAIDWELKESKSTPPTVDFAAPATDGTHRVEIGSEHVEEYGTVYEFRVIDDTGAPVYEFALSHHATAQGEGRTYQEFVELFTLAKHRAAARSGKSR
jgi:hypothetical protein